MLKNKPFAMTIMAIFSGFLTACSTPTPPKQETPQAVSKIFTKTGHIADTNLAVNRLSQQQQAWKGTRYRLGGTSRKGVDCSAFMQITFRDLFGISLPRTTNEQAKKGIKVAKHELQAGDLVFFKTGRGPNGKHVGVYVKDGQFLHASTKGGVIYSNLHSPYWSKTFWQARRM